MRVPHTSLQPVTLRAVIEDLVTREGTEYGEREVTLEHRP